MPFEDLLYELTVITVDSFNENAFEAAPYGLFIIDLVKDDAEVLLR